MSVGVKNRGGNSKGSVIFAFGPAGQGSVRELDTCPGNFLKHTVVKRVSSPLTCLLSCPVP